MGKLSKIELDVVSNEIYSKVVNEVESNYLSIIEDEVDLSLFKKLREIEIEKNKLEKELDEFINNVNDELDIRISYNSLNNWNNVKEDSELFRIVGSVDYNVKRNIEKELILNGIDKGLDIKELINNMVNKIVNEELGK